MRNFVRAAAVLGIGAILLAAAPYVGPMVGNEDSELPFDIADIDQPAVQTAAEAIAPAFAEDAAVAEIAEPAIGPVLPEAQTLAEMVRGVRTLEGIELDSELRCLATAVYFESKGEPLEGQLAVAQVILNRVENGRFGNSICAVVKAPRQFSFVRGGSMPAPGANANWQIARAIAVIAASEGWRDVVGNATHFHAVYVNPRWKMRRVAAIGNHIFYH